MNSDIFCVLREVYRFVAYECKIYIPSLETITMAHLKDILTSKKVDILLDEVKPIVVPQYKGLTVEKILEFARNYEDMMNVIPIKKEILKLER